MREVPEAIAGKLTEAADAFASSFEDLRMDDIARASGIPRATLYYYFSGKDDILGFLFAAMLAEIRVGLAAAADAGGSVRDRLGGLVRALLTQMATHPAAAQLLLTNLGRAGKLPDMAAGLQEAAYGPFERVVAEGMAGGELRPRDAAVTAVALFGAVCIAGLQALVTEGHLEGGRLAATLEELFWAGLAAEQPPTGRRT
ncbi:MAG: TetR/AcrR family transcriptional regulator [Acidobacteriota bacterium]|nr:TetR/AcrR family transcriptional regulator [Acidobacteriota bacterium]